MVGLDFSKSNIRFCERVHKENRVTFVLGDAQDMPFRSGSFDVVSNIESSHCYPSLPRFYSEVRRILRPGGAFFHADNCRDDAEREYWLKNIGFGIVRKRDLRVGVLRALRANARFLEGQFRGMTRGRKASLFAERLLRGLNQRVPALYDAGDLRYPAWSLVRL